ncbi:MAG: PPC domain-containing protein [Anaerolineae bacterium]|nr:PPC domain-containing protein [Anaerolineae bacterium]
MSRRLALLLIPLWLFLSASRADAQEALQILDTVTGELAANDSHDYAVNGRSGEVVSFRVEAQSSGLDAALILTDSSGRVIAADDDRAYPDQLDPLLQAVTLPRADTYTLRVRSVGATSGSYTLTMTPGLAAAAYTGFGEGGWTASPEGSTIDVTPDRVILTAEGARLTRFATGEGLPQAADLYAQVDVIAVSSQSGTWAAGLTFRDSGSARYAFVVDHSGVWRFSLFDDSGERVIRDWSPHPAIVAGRTPFTLSVLAVGGSFDFFYDSTYIGSAVDDALNEAGDLGLMAVTPSALSTVNILTFANLIVTTPDGGNEAASSSPEGIFVSADGRAMVTALRRQFVAGADGEMSLNLPESSVQYNRAGVNLLGIGRGVRYSSFMLGFTATLTADPTGSAGCGIAFHALDETHYTLAYFNQEGAYGISRREGDLFAPGIVGALPDGGAQQHHLLIIASDNTLTLYIDGVHVGSQAETADDGSMSIAVVNFEPNTTTCQFDDLWVWAWE